MTAFRIFLIVIFCVVALYTVPVVVNHGLDLLPIFFGDMMKMGWPGQFNLDFLGFLVLSAFWTAWRNNYSPVGFALSVLALFLGAPFLTMYLFYLSVRNQGDVKRMLMGEQRASA